LNTLGRHLNLRQLALEEDANALAELILMEEIEQCARLLR